MVNAAAKTSFIRCTNSFDIPESVCTVCFHTLVARDGEALERAENTHDCDETTYGVSAFD